MIAHQKQNSSIILNFINDRNILIIELEPNEDKVLSSQSYKECMLKIEKYLEAIENVKIVLDFSKIQFLEDIGANAITYSFLKRLEKTRSTAVFVASKHLEGHFLLALLNIHRKFLYFDVFLDRQLAIQTLVKGKRQRKLPKGFWKTFVYRCRLINKVFNPNLD